MITAAGYGNTAKRPCLDTPKKDAEPLNRSPADTLNEGEKIKYIFISYNNQTGKVK